MSTYTLKVNFANYNPADTVPTVDGTETKGINIFKQQFNSNTTIDGTTGVKLSQSEIIEMLNKVLVCKKDGTDVEGAIVDTIGTHASGEDPLAPLLEGGLTKDETNGTYKLNPGYGLVFEAKQSNGTSSYITYYCYLKERLEVPDGSDVPGENLWSVFITNKNRAPLIFDVQDERDIIFTVTKVDSVDAIKSIDTTNFVVVSQGNGYKKTGYELKNTSFNLATDDKGEAATEIYPYLSFKYHETA